MVPHTFDTRNASLLQKTVEGFRCPNLDCSIVYVEGALKGFYTLEPSGYLTHMLSPVSNRVRGGNSLHISCRNSASTKSFPQSSLTIHFYLKTIRGKLNRITLECDVLLKTSARLQAEPSIPPIQTD